VSGWWRRQGRLVVPFSLAVALLAIVVIAGLAPNATRGSVESSCTYGQCPASQAFPVWAVTTALAVVVVALLLALLFLRRRRRPGSPAEPSPASGVEGEQGEAEPSEFGGPE
jgi:ABC-type transport system involved in cytochrome c biogenesis permease subunit